MLVGKCGNGASIVPCHTQRVGGEGGRPWASFTEERRRLRATDAAADPQQSALEAIASTRRQERGQCSFTGAALPRTGGELSTCTAPFSAGVSAGQGVQLWVPCGGTGGLGRRSGGLGGEGGRSGGGGGGAGSGSSCGVALTTTCVIVCVNSQTPAHTVTRCPIPFLYTCKSLFVINRLSAYALNPEARRSLAARASRARCLLSPLAVVLWRMGGSGKLSGRGGSHQPARGGEEGGGGATRPTADGGDRGPRATRPHSSTRKARNDLKDHKFWRCRHISSLLLWRSYERHTKDIFLRRVPAPWDVCCLGTKYRIPPFLYCHYQLGPRAILLRRHATHT